MTDLSRRDVLRGLGLTAGAAAAISLAPGGLLPGALSTAGEAFAASPPATPSLTPKAAIARLTAGNRRFVNGTVRNPRRDSKRRAALAEGQAPFAAVLGCADSRVPPEVIYDEGLGNLFVARVAGNTTADALVAGSLEYSIAVLGSVVIVVLGHEQCGAVKAAIDVVTKGTELPGDLPAVVAPILPIVQTAVDAGTPADQLLDVVTKENIRQAVQTLTANPLLAGYITQGKLAVVGREYLLASGRAVAV
jgi:carbonic anhydrase